MTVIERCPGMTASGRCHRRPAHHGHCATGGSYANALDERDDARQQLDGAVEALEEIFDDLEDAPISSYWPGAYHARQVAEMALERLRGGQ